MGLCEANDSHQFVRSLGKLPTSDLVRFTLQKPDVARIFASSLHLLAVEAASSSFPNVGEPDLASSHVDILARLIERGDPSLARKFVPTQGSLVDLAIAAPSGTRPVVATILERLLDASSVKEIVGGLSAQLVSFVSVENPQDSAATSSSIRTLARISSAFLAVCPSRLLKGNIGLIQAWVRTSTHIYDKTLPQIAKSFAGDATATLNEPDLASLGADSLQLHWLTCRVDLLQLISTLLGYLGGSAKLIDALRESLAESEKLLSKGGFSTLLNSTVLLDLAVSTDSWPYIRAELASSVLSKKGQSNDTIASIDALATSVPKFTGAAWDALRRFIASQTPNSSETLSQAGSRRVGPASEDDVAFVDSILPHYGMERLRTILSRPSFAGQSTEMVIQRLLEGDEGDMQSSGTARSPQFTQSMLPAAVSHESTTIAAPSIEASALPSSSAAQPSLVRSRANVFGDFAFDPASIVQPKLARTGRVDELAPELKAAILARAEAADDDEAEEEWNPFAEGHRTVGVEDELDLDYDGRERGPALRLATDEDDNSDEDDEGAGHDHQDQARMRERVLLRHYVQHGSASFSTDATTRRSEARQQLKEQTGLSDDLIESWAVMLERNPRKDRLLAAASQSELDEQLATRDSRNYSDEDNEDAAHARRFGPDRGRGGRILRGGSRGGGHTRTGGDHAGGSNPSSGSGPQTKKPTRGRGTGNSGTDRSAKQKEKAGNKARQRGHDKKMARVNPNA